MSKNAVTYSYTKVEDEAMFDALIEESENKVHVLFAGAARALTLLKSLEQGMSTSRCSNRLGTTMCDLCAV